MKREKKKRKVIKLSKVEQAIIYIADYLEIPNHDQYQVKRGVLDILGIELLNK